MFVDEWGMTYPEVADEIWGDVDTSYELLAYLVAGGLLAFLFPGQGKDARPLYDFFLFSTLDNGKAYT